MVNPADFHRVINVIRDDGEIGLGNVRFQSLLDCRILGVAEALALFRALGSRGGQRGVNLLGNGGSAFSKGTSAANGTTPNAFFIASIPLL